MDELAQDFQYISPKTKREPPSPLSPKLPTLTNFQELLTFQETTGSPLLLTTRQRIAGLVFTADSVDAKGQNSNDERGTEFIVIPVTKLTVSHAGSELTGSSKPRFLAAERTFLHLKKSEQLRETERDKLYPCLLDAEEVLAQSDTANDTDMSSHPDCRELGGSFQDEFPGGFNLPVCNGKDGKQVDQSACPIRAFTHTSSDKDVRCQSECSNGNMLHENDSCDTFSQSALSKESKQKTTNDGFIENLLLSKETKEINSLVSSSDYGVESCFSKSEDESGGLAENAKTEEKLFELQICGNENLAVFNGETKGQIKEKGPSQNSILASAECARGSDFSSNVVLAGNIAYENVSLEAILFNGAKTEDAAGKMSEMPDLKTESPVPARISQEPAEGDNDVGLSVIDSAIWSETDGGVEEKLCNSESTAGAQLFPSVNVYEMEMPLPLCSDARPSHDVSALDQTWQSPHRCRTQTSRGETKDLCQSYAEPQAHLITAKKTRMTAGSCLNSSRSRTPEFPSAGDRRQECCETLGHELTEHSQLFAFSLDHVMTEEAEYLEIASDRKDGAAGVIKVEETNFGEERKIDEYWKSENSSDSGETFVQLNVKVKEDKNNTTAGSVCDQTAGEASSYGSKLTHTGEELGAGLECLSDHIYNAATPIKERATEGNDRKQENNTHDNLGFITENHPQPNPPKEDMMARPPDDGTSEWAGGTMSQSSFNLTPVFQLEQENKAKFYPDCQHNAETLSVENKDGFLGFMFSTTSNAVVAQHKLFPSQKMENSIALNCCDKFPPLPSAVGFCNSAPGGSDTFERIQLSLDGDYEDAAGPSNGPAPTSLPGQLSTTPQQKLHSSTPQSASDNGQEEAPAEAEEDVDHLEHDLENMANGFLSSDYSWSEPLNFFSEADVEALRWPEQQADSESAWKPSETIHSVSPDRRLLALDGSRSPEFEMRSQFSMVLKELNLYFNISMSDCTSNSTASPEWHSEVPEALMEDTASCDEQFGHHRDKSSDEEDHSLGLGVGDPVVSCSSGSGEGEQEVPIGSQLEASRKRPKEDTEPQEAEQKEKMWSPSFTRQPFSEEPSNGLPERARKLEPLRTCSRPIRVGLSKRAKTKRLHHPHPYK